MIFTGLSESKSESITIGEDIHIFNAAKTMLLGKGFSCTVAGLFSHAHTQILQCMWGWFYFISRSSARVALASAASLQANPA